MATNNSEPQKESEVVDQSMVNKKLKKGGPLNLLLIFLIIGLVVYGGFLSFDKGRVLEQTSALEAETLDIQSQIDTIRGDKVEVSQNASDALKQIEQGEVRWSEVISEVDKLIPQNASGDKLVSVLSYSGSGQGRIALNMVTLPEALPPFDDVAQLIKTFNSNVFFRDAYVPSISKSSNEGGGITLSFVLNMEYDKPETGSEDFSSLTIPSEIEVDRVPVPRTPDVEEPIAEIIETPALDALELVPEDTLSLEGEGPEPIIETSTSTTVRDLVEPAKVPRTN
jgi:hypothetical protein